MERASGVTFDFGQTLADLDVEMLSRRLGERDLDVLAARLEAATPAAWHAYNQAIVSGHGGHPWKILMARLLAEAGAPEGAIEGAVDWLWDQQPIRNLWRRPVPGMIELVKELREAGIPVGVVSNSEGKLAELIDELEWGSHFLVVADSGKLGMEKPGREIFEWAADRLGLGTARLVHIGDARAADVEGALGAGMRAIWFRGAPSEAKDDRMAVCHSASEVRAALVAFGIDIENR